MTNRSDPVPVGVTTGADATDRADAADGADAADAVGGAGGADDPTSATFLAAVALTPTAPQRFDRAYLATTQYCPWPKAYGGDMVAQAVMAAMASTGDDRNLHSMHSYFLRPVDIGAQVRYEVELLRDGRGYSTRQVRGYSADGKPVYVCLASFGVPEDDLDHAAAMPSGLPEPESLPSSAQVLAGRTDPAATYWAAGRSFDQRHVPGPVYTEVVGERVPVQAVWLKPFGPLPDDQALHTAALAYVCDYTILEPVLRVHGLAWADPGLVTASLDHAMWFHRPARLDDWVLYSQRAVSAQSGRGLARGYLHDRTGRLMATVLQEGMIRRGVTA
jgi:acyl-CoA thioesterase-2